jgi:phosphoribosylformylglycinamidine synthase subunit PurS
MEIRVKPRPGLLDPQGKAIHHALESLGYPGVAEVRVGKLMDLELDADSQDEARERAEEMCRKLLANPVTEDFQVTVAGEGEIPGEETAGAGKASDGAGTGGGDA